MSNISFGRGSAPRPPQQPNTSAPAAADTNVDPEPPRAPTSAPANAATSQSIPPPLKSEEHWPALDRKNYRKPKKRRGRGRGRGRAGAGAGAGEPNSGGRAPASSPSSADPTGGEYNQNEGLTSAAPESQPPTDAGAGQAEVATPETAATEAAAAGSDINAPLDIDKLMKQPMSWPPNKEENAQIDNVLYGRRKGHKRLPVFKDICPD